MRRATGSRSALDDRHLPGGRRERRNAHGLEAPPEHAGKAVGQGRAENGQLRQDARVQRNESGGADHHRNADEAHDDAGEFLPREALVDRQVMRHDHREERRRGVENRGQPAGDMALPPDDEREGNHVVEDRPCPRRPPRPDGCAAAPRPSASRSREGPGPPSPPEPPRWSAAAIPHGDADEKEGPAPDNGKDGQQRPIGRRHGLLNGRLCHLGDSRFRA